MVWFLFLASFLSVFPAPSESMVRHYKFNVSESIYIHMYMYMYILYSSIHACKYATSMPISYAAYQIVATDPYMNIHDRHLFLDAFEISRRLV